ncbi:carbamate kinase, partial [Klebsiella quasipneumoniae]|nr:carbamate kinase [Klebsiella quasipneumoniae]
IDYVYINYHTDQQQALKTTNIDTLKTYIEEKQFAKGSMLPKIESAISFIENNPNGSVLITSLNQLDAALEGKIGTLITK